MIRGSSRVSPIKNLACNDWDGLIDLKSIRYQTLFQNLPIPTLVLSLRNQILFCNNEFELFSGYRLKEVIGNDLLDIMIPLDALQPAKFLFGRLLLGEKVYDKQLIKIKDGSEVEVWIKGTPILQKEEQVGVLIIFEQIFSPENNFYRDFEQIKKLSEINQLLGALGHELRNPLCIIKNAAYLVEKRIIGSENEDSRKYLKIIRREAEMGNKIIANLLHFIRTKEPQRQWIDPLRPVKEVLIRYPLPENITLDLKSNNQPIRILVDPDQIEIVLLNLITNAVQAMATGGKLRITLKSDDSRFIYQISDTGRGIPTEEMKKIFQPFFTTRRNGIGLGLAITKQLVEANQGKISAQSEVGSGTTFSIEFANPNYL